MDTTQSVMSENKNNSEINSDRIENCPTYSQERLFYLHQLIPNNSSLNFQTIINVDGEFDLEVFEKCFNEIVKRFDVLRSNYYFNKGSIHSSVQDYIYKKIETFSTGHLSSGDYDEVLQKHIEEDGKRVFNIQTDLLYRIKVLQESSRKSTIILTTHHIIFDVISANYFISQISDLYSSYLTTGEFPREYSNEQYYELANIQREKLTDSFLNQQQEYWSGQLSGPLTKAELFFEGNNTKRTTIEGERSVVEVEGDLLQRISLFCEKHHVDIANFLLSAYSILIYRYTNQTDIIVGYSFKELGIARTDNTIGCYINPLPIRSDFTQYQYHIPYIKYIDKLKSEILDYSEIPFQNIIDKLQIQRENEDTIFSLMFEYHKLKKVENKSHNISFDIVAIDSEVNNRTSRLDLTIEAIHRENSLFLAFEYSTDKFTGDIISRIQKHYLTLLQSMLCETDQDINTLKIIPDDELTLMTDAWNTDLVEYSPGTLMHELFQEQASLTPGSVALLFEETEMTYKELNEKANQLAHYMLQSGIVKGSYIGIYINHSLSLPIALLATLKCGCICVPLDSHLPTERLAAILEDCKSEVVLTHDPLANNPIIKDIKSINVDNLHNDISEMSVENLNVIISEEDLAFVFYTSGSTGKPKGVMVYHKGRGNLLRWEVKTFDIKKQYTHLMKTSTSAGVFIKEFFWPLITGGLVVIAKPEKRQDSAYLVDLIIKNNINVITCVPTILNLLLSEKNITACKSIEKIFCSGEYLSEQLKNDCLTKLPALLYNTFGMNEISTATYDIFDKTDGFDKRVTIGKLRSVNIVLLDKYNQIVPIGLPGEICVSGLGMAKGYLNRDELTQKKFYTGYYEDGSVLFKTGDLAYYRSDGYLVYVERTDDQIKIRGNRVELNEIDIVLKQYSEINDCVTIARDNGSGQKILVSYVVLSDVSKITTQEIRKYCREKLPEYMIPGVVLLDEIPMTDIGKVDKQLLPDFNNKADEETLHDPPQTEIEKKIAEIWMNTLQRDFVNRSDNFFDIGGDSLKSLQVAAMLELEFGVEIQLEFLIHKTLKEIAGEYA